MKRFLVGLIFGADELAHEVLAMVEARARALAQIVHRKNLEEQAARALGVEATMVGDFVALRKSVKAKLDVFGDESVGE